MSRHGYIEDCDSDDNWAMIMWSGRVKSAIRGKRGQKLLRELLAALDSMPEKRLIPEELQDEDGDVCALGCLGRQRGLDLTKLDPEDHEQMAAAFDVAPCLIREIEYQNDDYWDRFTPEERWLSVRSWVARQIKPDEKPDLNREQREQGCGRSSDG